MTSLVLATNCCSCRCSRSGHRCSGPRCCLSRESIHRQSGLWSKLTRSTLDRFLCRVLRALVSIVVIVIINNNNIVLINEQQAMHQNHTCQSTCLPEQPISFYPCIVMDERRTLSATCMHSLAKTRTLLSIEKRSFLINCQFLSRKINHRELVSSRCQSQIIERARQSTWRRRRRRKNWW